MGRSLRVGCGRTDRLNRSSDQRHRAAAKRRNYYRRQTLASQGCISRRRPAGR